MKIIDIMNLFPKFKTIILDIDKNYLYISKFILNMCYISKIDLNSFEETIIVSWHCNEIEYRATNISIYKNQFLIFIQKQNNLLIKKIDRDVGKIIFEKIYPIDGNIFDSKRTIVLNENHIIVFFQELKTFSYDGFLFDLSEDKSYCIYDRKVVDSIDSKFICYSIKDTEYICFEELYMDVYDKKSIYDAIKLKEIVFTDCFESLNTIKLDEFIYSIKCEMDEIPFKVIDKISSTGYIRYLGMDKNHIYYRIINFETGVENIYSVSKIRFKKSNILNIEHVADSVEYIYDFENIKVYRVESCKTIAGILNSNLYVDLTEIEFKSIEYIDKKQIVLNLKSGDTGILNLNTGNIQHFSGKNYRIKNNIIVY